MHSPRIQSPSRRFAAQRVGVALLCALVLAAATHSAAELVRAQPGSGGPENPDWRPRDGRSDLWPFFRPDIPLPPAAPEQPEVVLPWSKLAFTSQRDGNAEVYFADDDLGMATRVTNDAGTDTDPALRRSADRIAFASNRTGKYEIYLVNPDGSDLVRITNSNPNDREPAWSPDGTQIAYQNDRSDVTDVYKMDANGQNVVRLTRGDESTYAGQPAWSPDGTRIAFTAYRDHLWRIWVMNADGTGQTQLSGQAYSENPAWSPDGTRIAFDADSNSNGYQELWVINADGSDAHMLHQDSGAVDNLSADWSPEGRYVAYLRVTWSGGYWTSASPHAWDTVTSSAVSLSQSDSTVISLSWDSLDIWPPTTSMSQPAATSPATFSISWSGVDTGPSGVASYDVEVRDGAGGVWTALLTGTTAQSTSYTGVGGHTYYFRVRGRDYAGNVEPSHAEPDAWTTVEALPPTAWMYEVPAYILDGQVIRWSGTDTGGSGILSYEVHFRDVDGGAWINWIPVTTATSAAFTGVGTGGHRYAFRARATDRAQNVGDWSAETSPATIYAVRAAGRVIDLRGRGIPGANVSFSPSAIVPAMTGLGRVYQTYLPVTATYSILTSHAGYAQPPAMTLGITRTVDLLHLLAPTANAIANGGFEATGDPFQGWTLGGNTAPATATPGHTGARAAVLDARSWVTWTTDVFPTNTWGFTLAVDSSGVAHMVTGAFVEPDHYYTYYQYRSPDGSWSTPVQIATECTPMIINTAIALTPSEELHIVYNCDGQVKHIHKTAGGSWSTPVLVNNPPETPRYDATVSMAADSQGHIHLARDYWNGGPGDEDWTIAYQVWTEAAGWSETELLGGGNSTWPALVVDPADRVHLVIHRKIWDPTYLTYWYDADARYCTIGLTTPGIWGCDNSLGVHQYHGLIVADAQGTLHVVTHDRDQGSARYLRRAPGTSGWTAVTVPQISWYPHIAVDSISGTVYFVGHIGEDIGAMENTYFTWRTANGEWGPLELLSWGSNPYATLITSPDERPYLLYSGWGDNRLSIAAPFVAKHSALSQSLTVPTGHAPTLGFLYALAGPFNTEDAFAVSLTDAVTTTVLLTVEPRASDWTHLWADLSPWAGQAVSLTFDVTSLAAPGGTRLMLDEISVGAWTTPVVDSVTPGDIPAQTATAITIIGENFAQGAAVRVGATTLSGVVWVDEHTVTATLPPLAAGPHALLVTNPDGAAGGYLLYVGHALFLPAVGR